jgi:hypothetical protein
MHFRSAPVGPQASHGDVQGLQLFGEGEAHGCLPPARGAVDAGESRGPGEKALICPDLEAEDRPAG